MKYIYQIANRNKFEQFLLLLKPNTLEIKETMLLAFNLIVVDFNEEYKLRPDSYINSF